MDFITTWKASSIVLTGAFGVLGLLKDFKDKVTHKVTLWGYISLAGIVLSTALGVAAQLKESSDEQVARKITAEQTRAAAEQTLEIVKNSSATLRQVKRTLSSLSGASMELDFHVPCIEREFKKFCSVAKSGRLDLGTPQGGLMGWPTGSGKFIFYASLNVFAHRSDAEKYIRGEAHFGDLAFNLRIPSDELFGIGILEMIS
jgi:hypothetical protein